MVSRASHLYRFQIGNEEYGEPSPYVEAYDPALKNSRRTKLAQLALRKRSTFRYEYDFGDGWLHKLVIEKILGRKLS